MKKTLLFIFIALFLVGNVMATGLSVQLKRTNPGVVGEKSAELIFDVVNTDLTHKIEGFIFCRTPDDAVITSTLGASTGSGAQYVSPKFTMDTGPYQRSMSITLESDTVGDKRADCTFKYIPFKETVITGEEITEDIDFEGSITTEETDVSGFNVKLVSYTAEVEEIDEETNETTTVPAKVEISVDGETKEIEVGSTETIGALTITVNSATEESADVTITGQKVTEEGATSEKEYLKQNGQYINIAQDSDYRELRLDKTVPFVSGMNNPECPEGKTECKASEVIDVGGYKIPIIWIILGVIVIILIIAYLMGKTSRS